MSIRQETSEKWRVKKGNGTRMTLILADCRRYNKKVSCLSFFQLFLLFECFIRVNQLNPRHPRPIFFRGTTCTTTIFYYNP